MRDLEDWREELAEWRSKKLEGFKDWREKPMEKWIKYNASYTKHMFGEFMAASKLSEGTSLGNRGLLHWPVPRGAPRGAGVGSYRDIFGHAVEVRREPQQFVWGDPEEWHQRSLKFDQMKNEKECCEALVEILDNRVIAEGGGSIPTLAALDFVRNGLDSVNQQWASYHETNELAANPGAWKEYITPDILEYLHNVVLDEYLDNVLATWDRIWNPTCRELGVLIPFIGHLPQKFWPRVEAILKDASKEILGAFKNYVDKETWDMFCDANIFPRIRSVLHKLQITPPYQMDNSFKFAVDLNDAVYLDDMVGILTKEFVPKWKRSLENWVSMKIICITEAEIWCRAWKHAMPANLRAHPYIVAMFDEATQFVHTVLGQ